MTKIEKLQNKEWLEFAHKLLAQAKDVVNRTTLLTVDDDSGFAISDERIERVVQEISYLQSDINDILKRLG